jgi:hypothetical protein
LFFTGTGDGSARLLVSGFEISYFIVTRIQGGSMSLTKRSISRVGGGLAIAGIAVLLTATATQAQQASTAQSQTPATGIRITATSANVSQPGEAVRININRWSTDQERDALVTAMNPAPPRGEAGARGGARGGAGRGAARGGAVDPAPDPAAVADPTDPFGTFRRGAAADGAANGAAGAAPAAAAGAAPAAAAGAPQAGRGGRGAPSATPPALRPAPTVALGEALGKASTIGYLWTSEVAGYPIKYAYRIPSADGDRVILAIDRRLGAFSPSWKPANGAATDYSFTLIELKLAPKGLGEGKTSLTSKVAIDNAAKTVALEDYASATAIFKNVKQ